MFFQIKKSRLLSFTIIVVLLSSFMCSASANETDVFLVVNDAKPVEIKKILDNFSDDKFNSFLKEITNYSASEYQAGICNLFTAYKNSYSDLNLCNEKIAEERNSYSNKWATDIMNRFDAQYISTHIESIKKLILNIHLKNISAFCKESEKQALYDEIQYIITTREYFYYFLKFYNALDANEKALYASPKKKADDLLELLNDYPLQRIMYGKRLGAALDLSNQVTLKSEVVDFLVDHDQLKRPFNPVTAINDIILACRLGKTIDK